MNTLPNSKKGNLKSPRTPRDRKECSAILWLTVHSRKLQYMSIKKGNKTLAAPSLADTKQISIEVLDGVDPYKQGYSYQDIINFRRNAYQFRSTSQLIFQNKSTEVRIE